ncbi:MAG: hypothetical protein JWM88_1297 [Verrucomicrobia bacterium]|nr:hypothetical protein [Verrucomicrobiota bacterium]
MVVVAAVRLALPSILRRGITARLEKIPEYTGRVEKVDLAVWRGAYTLHRLVVMKRGDPKQDPFFRVERVDFSIAWRELIHRRLVSDIVLEKPMLTLIKAPSTEATQVAIDRRWQAAINDIFPVNITLLKVTDGEVRYVNDTLKPKVDIRVAHLRALATGLRNRPDESGGEFPARLTFEGETIGGGSLKLAAQAEPLAAEPHFLLKAEVERVSLPALNEFLRAYAGVDVSKGTFSGYLEVAARDGHYQGYFKPFFDQVDFSEQPGESEPVSRQLRELFVRMFTWVFKNHPRDEVATRIPFEGEFKNLNYSTWETFLNMVRHAFVHPLQKKLDSQAPGGEGAKGDEAKLPEPKK